MSRTKIASVFLGALLAPSVAWATFHQIKLVEVFAGSAAAPNAQYVEIQLVFSSEIQISGQPLRIFDSNGVQLQQFIIPADLNATVLTQPKVLFATSEAEALFSITADFQVALNLPRSGGKICYGNDDNNLPIDCASWGTFTGDPQETGLPFQGQAGLQLGQAIKRRLDISGDPNSLALTDDTGDSDNDFRYADPRPVNFAGVAGTIPAFTCGNAIAEGTEGCDDGSNTNGDGCDDTCAPEFCGDGTVQPNEQCDDNNGDTNDDCPNTCLSPVCGDNSVQVGVEECDDGGLVAGDGCDAACKFEGLAGCGNGAPNGTEECDDGNLVAGDGCDATCQDEVCGDGITNNFPQEACDDGNTTDGDGCSATCQDEVCGDGITQANEECDDGNVFGADGCDQLCRAEECGNGRQDFGEACDDGNAINGDGCENNCKDTVAVGGGNCSTGGSSPVGVWLLGVLGLLWWSRSKRQR